MKYSSANIDENGFLFGKWQLRPNVWAITNRWQNFIYLLIGEEKALLIDTGYGEGNLREFVEAITDKPIMVINTHGHFDHTGGNALWQEVWMSSAAVSQARQAFSLEQEKWFAAKPYQEYKVNYVNDGDILNIGGQEVEVLAIPAHSEGSIALLDHHSRILFTGDELESGQVLLFARRNKAALHTVVAAHKANMERLKARRGEYDFICPAHNGCMLEPDQYLDDFIALDEELLAGTAKIMPHTGGFGFPPDPSLVNSPFGRFGSLERAQHGQASLIYLKEKG